MNSKPTLDNIKVIKETEDFELVYDPDCDPFAVVDGVPNYFILNKTTRKVEFANNRIGFMLDLLPQMQRVHDGEEESFTPSLIPSEPVTH